MAAFDTCEGDDENACGTPVRGEDGIAISAWSSRTVDSQYERERSERDPPQPSSSLGARAKGLAGGEISPDIPPASAYEEQTAKERGHPEVLRGRSGLQERLDEGVWGGRGGGGARGLEGA
jgi:hypothetical protein